MSELKQSTAFASECKPLHRNAKHLQGNAFYLRGNAKHLRGNAMPLTFFFNHGPLGAPYLPLSASGTEALSARNADAGPRPTPRMTVALHAHK